MQSQRRIRGFSLHDSSRAKLKAEFLTKVILQKQTLRYSP